MNGSRLTQLPALIVLALAANAYGDDPDIEAQQQLEDARTRLEAAAREVADLSSAVANVVIGSMSHEDRAMLGINIAPVMLADRVDNGVEIGGVTPGGPAAIAGLRAGDIVLAVDGQALEVSRDTKPIAQLLEFMRDVKPGDDVVIRYRRGNNESEVTVTTEAMHGFDFDFDAEGMGQKFVFKFPDDLAGDIEERLKIVTRFGPGFDRLPPGWHELEFVPMNPGLGSYFGTETGLLVTRAPESGDLPLQAGDVITRIGAREPVSPVKAMRILNTYEPGETVQLEVIRQRESMVIEVTIPEPDRQSWLNIPLYPG